MNILKSFQKYSYLIILFIPFLLMLIIAWPSLNSQGILGALDAEGHNLRGLYWAHYLLPHGKLHGWFPYWFGGFDTYITYSPLTFYILGLMSFIFNSTLTVRIFCLICWMGIPFSSYLFLRSFRLGKVYASIGALLTFQLNLFSLGCDSIYAFGLLPSALAFVLSILSLASLKRLLNFKEIPLIQIFYHALLMSFTFLAHGVFYFWFFITSVMFLIINFSNKEGNLARNNFRILISYFLSAVITSFWWVPFLKNQASMNVADVFNFPTTIALFKNVINLLSFGTLILILIAIIPIFISNFRLKYIQILLIPLLSLILCLGLLPLPYGLVSRTQATRFEGYIQWSILMMIPLSLRFFLEMEKIHRNQVYKSFYFIFMTTLLLNGTLFAFKNLKSGIIIIENQETKELIPLVDFLKREMRGGDFVLSETSGGSYISYGSPHFLAQRLPQFLPQYADLAGSFIEGVKNAEESIVVSRSLNSVKVINEHLSYLRERGTRFILSTQLHSFETLMKIPWLQLKWTGPLKESTDNNSLLTGLPNGNFISVFELKNYDRRAGLSHELSEKLRSFEFIPPDHYQIQFVKKITIREGNVIGINANSFMRLFINGREIKTGSNQFGQIKILEEIPDVEKMDLIYSVN